MAGQPRHEPLHAPRPHLLQLGPGLGTGTGRLEDRHGRVAKAGRDRERRLGDPAVTAHHRGEAMSAMQRRKGQAAEREVFRLLADQLGTVVTRNLSQTREGGADSISIPGWAIEVKRQEREYVTAWWRQTCDQAAASDPPRRPLLLYRRNRVRLWHARVCLADLAPHLGAIAELETAEISLPAACALIRETLP